MRRSRSYLYEFLGLLSLLLLSGCGVLQVQVEPLSVPATNTPFPATPSLAPTERISSETPTPRAVVTETPSPVAPKSDLRPGVPLQILQTHMLDVQNGWAIGQAEGTSVQRILFTGDGGRSWQDRSPLEVFANLTPDGLRVAAYFASAQSAWSIFTPPQQAGEKKPLIVWHTLDGGKTWKKSQPLDMAGINMEFQVPSDLGFSDDQHGWILVHLGVGMSHDYIALFTTQDGGVTWLRRLDPSTQFPVMSCYKSGLVFISPSLGWLAGNCPGLMPKLFFFVTPDNGQSWSEISLPEPQGKTAGYYSQPDIGCGITHLQALTPAALAVTLSCTNYANNTYLSWLFTTQDGTAWTQHVLPVPNTQIAFMGSAQAVLLGAARLDPDTGGQVFSTSDSGASWTLLSATGWTGTPDFINLQNGWIVAEHNQVTAFVHTANGGATWEEIKPLSGN